MPDSSSLEPMQRIILSVGAYVLQTQHIEQLFKFLLPMTNADDPSLRAILKRQAAVSKKTLGTLSGQFVDVSSGDTLALEAYVWQVVADRNEVVHHFYERFGAPISAKEYGAVFNDLQIRRERASKLARTLREFAVAVIEALRDSTFNGTEQHQEMADLCHYLGASLDREVAVAAPGPVPPQINGLPS